MSKNNIELLKWGDGTIRLAFWDSLHGDDAIFVLWKNGQAFRSEVEYASPDDEVGMHHMTPVNLVRELYSLALAWETENEEE